MPLTLLPDSCCDICAEEYDTANPALTPSVVPCGHVVCRRCWSALQPRVCPFCRAPFSWDDVRTLNCEIGPAPPPGALFGTLNEFKDSLEALPEVDEPAPTPEPEPEPEPTLRERQADKAKRLLHKLHDAFQREREAGSNDHPDMVGDKRILKTRYFLQHCEERRDHVALELATDMLEAFLDMRRRHKREMLAEEAHRIEVLEEFTKAFETNMEMRLKARMEELERQRAPVAPAYYSHYTPASRTTTPYGSPPTAGPLRSFQQIPVTNDHNPMPVAPSIHGSLRRPPYGRTSSPDVRSSPYTSSPAPIAGPSRTASYSSYTQRMEVDSIPLLQPPPSARHFTPQSVVERPHPHATSNPPPAPPRHFSPFMDDTTPSTSMRQFPPVRSEAGPPPRAPTARRRALPTEEELERQPVHQVATPSPPPADDATGSGDPNYVFSLWRPGQGNVTPDVWVGPSSTRLADLPPRRQASVSAYVDDDRPQRRLVYEAGPSKLHTADAGDIVLYRPSPDDAPPEGNHGAAPQRMPVQHYRQRSREQVRNYYAPPPPPPPDTRTRGLWAPMDSDSDAVRGL